MILFAGVLAENMNNGEIDIKGAINSLKTTGENDFSKIRELLNLLNNIRCNDNTNAQDNLINIEQELWGRAIDMVKEESQLIEGIASRFASVIEETHTKYTLSEQDLEEIPNLRKRFSD